MVIHASLFTSWAQELAKGRPLILCGDWNFKPVSEDRNGYPRRVEDSTYQPTNLHQSKGDAAYRLVTEGSIPTDDRDYPTPQDYDRSGWKPGVSPCASAYVCHHQPPSTVSPPPMPYVPCTMHHPTLHH